KRSDLAVVPKEQRGRKPKREDAEALKSRLALLDTCLEWPDGAKVSERMLHQSPLLKEKRTQLGLPEKVRAGTVHNHLQSLARVCRIDSLFNTEPKRQFSTFRAGVKERLLLRRPLLEDEIKAAEEHPRAVRSPKRSGPIPPEPEVIA